MNKGAYVRTESRGPVAVVTIDRPDRRNALSPPVIIGLGDAIDQEYKKALRVTNLSREQVADVLVDLKRRIRGEFFVIEESEEKIVFGNRACPFEDKVLGRPSMCMMTSNVFGSIAAENLGYAKVELQQAIARGDAGCRVVVYLRRTPESEAAAGREYVQG